MRLQSTIERKLSQEGEALAMVELSAAGSALAKAQKVTDTAFLGPSIAQKGQDQITPNPAGGWVSLTKRPTPELQAALAKLDEMDGI